MSFSFIADDKHCICVRNIQLKIFHICSLSIKRFHPYYTFVMERQRGLRSYLLPAHCLVTHLPTSQKPFFLARTLFLWCQLKITGLIGRYWNFPAFMIFKIGRILSDTKKFPILATWSEFQYNSPFEGLENINIIFTTLPLQIKYIPRSRGEKSKGLFQRDYKHEQSKVSNPLFFYEKFPLPLWSGSERSTKSNFFLAVSIARLTLFPTNKKNNKSCIQK